MEIYGRVDPDLSLEPMQRRQRLARYHTMLAKVAPRREALKVNPNRQPPTLTASDGQLAFGF